MSTSAPRKFNNAALAWQSFGDQRISLAPAVTKEEGGLFSAYFARFGAGEMADLPAPYDEIWVIMRGALTVRCGGHALTAHAGEFLHIPADTPGDAIADTDTELVCISVPAH